MGWQGGLDEGLEKICLFGDAVFRDSKGDKEPVFKVN